MQVDQGNVDEIPHALCEAAENGDLSRCRVLISRWQEHSKIHPVAVDLKDPLTAAIRSGHIDVVAFLMQNGAVVRGRDPMDAQGTKDAMAMYQTFYDHGWDVDTKVALGNVMLKYVICDQELVYWFLTHGANPNFGQVGCNSLDVAAASSTPVIFDLLVAHGASVADCDALHSAAGETEDLPGRIEMMTHLLNLGFDVNAIGRRHYPPGRRMGYRTPLHAAVESQEADHIEFLVRHGADMKARNTLGQTPLEYAIARGFEESQMVLERITASS